MLHFPPKCPCLPEACVRGCRLDNQQPHEFTPAVKSDNNNWYLNECRCTFVIMSVWIFRRMRNVSDKSFTESQTHISRKLCRLWESVEKYCRAGQATDGNIIRRMRIACWISKAHTAICTAAFPLFRWLRERASKLGYTCVSYLFKTQFGNFILFHYVKEQTLRNVPRHIPLAGTVSGAGQ